MSGLVLGRKVGESILIGDDIELTITKVNKDSGHVTVIIKAPREVVILRTELLNR